MFNERHTWAVILAGGNGGRMRGLIEEWLGYARPKQFCVFVGTRSMLQHTLDRVLRLIHPDRIITVIGEGQRRFLVSACRGRLPGWLIEQPQARGTAAAVLIATAVIRTLDPDATLLILPSDHFAWPESGFIDHLDNLISFASTTPDRLAVLAAEPTAPEADYGWIETGGPARSAALDCNNFREVLRFREKPSLGEAIEYLHRGYLWNTMASAVTAKTLWTLGEQLLPRFTQSLSQLTLPSRSATSELGCIEIPSSSLKATYMGLADADFSRDLLQKSPWKVAATPLQHVAWSDWGRPRRILDSLSDLGKSPHFLNGHERLAGVFA
ncbi:MAG TPA: sugar phosphate nucleotidyltransferase [Acidobacteriota bacterium]|nr:sugar phosphate nucleotidyltransferase [Acidobacteriota bacterium]